MPKSIVLGALFATCAASASTLARADEAADTAAARVLGGDGIILADEGNCEQAVEKLRRAEELHHAPSTAARLGECEIAIGRIVSGTERIQRLLREPLGANAPEPFVEAYARARRVLDKALPRIATLRISVRVPAGTKVHVNVDSDRLPDALLDNDRPTDPGHHAVTASAVGFITKSADVTLSEGETTGISLELSPDPSARANARREARATPSQAAMTQARPSERSDAGPIVAFTVGGAGLAVGVAGWVVVALDAADLSKSCGATKACPPSKGTEIDSAKTWATASTIGFAVAGAGIGTGLMLLVFGSHSESQAPAQAKVRPVVGPLYVGCEGAL